MGKLLKEFLYFILGFLILFVFYYISYFIINKLHLPFPPAILGLILFTFFLTEGIIKEKWVKSACDFLINNMAMFLVPIFCGLLAYKSLLAKNWLAIFIVIFITTTVVIVSVGLFVEWGIKFLRLNKVKTRKSEEQ